MKNNNHKKQVLRDNFVKHWCCSSHNHPEGWSWWKRRANKQLRKINKKIGEDDICY